MLKSGRGKIRQPVGPTGFNFSLAAWFLGGNVLRRGSGVRKRFERITAAWAYQGPLRVCRSRRQNACRGDHRNSGVLPKVLGVEGQEMSQAVHHHGGNEPSVVGVFPHDRR